MRLLSFSPWLTPIFFVVVALLQACESAPEHGDIFHASFEENVHGWVEERTDFHQLEIKDGHYFIACKDSNFNRTSTYALDRSFLHRLPEKYEINTSITIIPSKADTAYAGLVMESSSLEYEVLFTEYGEVWVEEYSYATKKRKYYDIDQPLERKRRRTFDLSIRIDGWDFELFVNDAYCTDGEMSAKSFERIAPFAGRFTSIQVDHLYLRTMH